MMQSFWNKVLNDMNKYYSNLANKENFNFIRVKSICYKAAQQGWLKFINKTSWHTISFVLFFPSSCGTSYHYNYPD